MDDKSKTLPETPKPPSPEKQAVLDQFNIEKQFDWYLERMGLDRRKMALFQIRETKRAFYGAWGQLIVLLNDKNTDLLTEKEVYELYADMAKQVNDFMTKETLSDQ